MPPAITMPPANVEDADDEVTLSKLVAIPPVKVEVAELMSRIDPPKRVRPLVERMPPGPN